MLYNSNIFYDEPGFTFFGNILIYVPELSFPIILNNITVQFSSNIDNSNSSTIGIVTIMSATKASISIQVNSEQASALISASSLNINEYSEVSIEY
jgi:hypothetical protein